MNVLVVADGHYFQSPDGSVYAESVYDYAFYKRYLQSFEHVYAAVRLDKIDHQPTGMKLSSGEGVTFLPLPAYRGPKEYAFKYFKILKCVTDYCSEYECAIFRIPAATSNMFCKKFLKTKKPFAVEVVIDPWENFGPRASGNKIMLFVVRRNWTNLVKKMCRKANGASYVTERYLQEKYPPRVYYETDGDSFTESYSSVELPDDSFASPRVWNKGQKTFWIAHVANTFTGYGKGHLVLMDAVKIVRDRGFDVRIKFVGDGPKREEFKQYSDYLGIGEYVVFTGRLANGNEVRKVIRDSDMFVLPTFAEGLPRVLLEAMAEGIPCLSSPTCGIPEILKSEYLFDFSDSEGFSNGITRFIQNSELMTRESAENLRTARKYSSSKLNYKRKMFYDKLARLTFGEGIKR
jgi:glycosyltransferase involved in cell wall biosynthesis